MKKLNKYSSNQFTKLLKLLSKYELNAEQETLHKIRITLKRIRSLFRLISFCEDTFEYRKQYRPLKKIFSEAGKIRNMYITQKLINKYGIELKKENDVFYSDNEKRMNRISSFLKRINSYQKLIYRIYLDTEKYTANIKPECFKEYIITRLTDLRNLIFPDFIEAKLHDARKICKEIIFLNEMSYNTNKSIDPFYDKLQDKIGEWHDKTELLKIIKNDEKDIQDMNTEDFENEIVSDLISIQEIVSDYYKNQLSIGLGGNQFTN